MKKITYEQACKILQQGEKVKCRVSTRQEIIIKDINELDQKKRLAEQGVQGFELYKEKENTQIPKGTIEVSIDDAYELISQLELVYCELDGKEEEINSRTDLTRIIMSSRIRGKEPVLYWYV